MEKKRFLKINITFRLVCMHKGNEISTWKRYLHPLVYWNFIHNNKGPEKSVTTKIWINKGIVSLFHRVLFSLKKKKLSIYYDTNEPGGYWINNQT